MVAVEEADKEVESMEVAVDADADELSLAVLVSLPELEAAPDGATLNCCD